MWHHPSKRLCGYYKHWSVFCTASHSDTCRGVSGSSDTPVGAITRVSTTRGLNSKAEETERARPSKRFDSPTGIAIRIDTRIFSCTSRPRVTFQTPQSCKNLPFVAHAAKNASLHGRSGIQAYLCRKRLQLGLGENIERTCAARFSNYGIVSATVVRRSRAQPGHHL